MTESRWNRIAGGLAQQIAAEKVRPPEEPRGYSLGFLWTEFDTTKEPAEWLNFLQWPLASLTEQPAHGVSVRVDGLGLEGVTKDWHVVTTIKNHHRGLNPRIACVMATLSEEEGTVYLDIYKQNP